MKKLFKVGSNYFDDKQKAKAMRDASGFPLERGPDHMGPHGCKGVPHKHAQARKVRS